MAVVCAFCVLSLAHSQDLAPRAYVITPLRWNAITLTYSYNSGSLQFDGALPITGATAKISTDFHVFVIGLVRFPLVILFHGGSLL
jgi:hypothetical protein